MSARYPRIVQEGDKCLFKLFDPRTERDLESDPLSKETAFALMLSLMSFIETKMREMKPPSS